MTKTLALNTVAQGNKLREQGKLDQALEYFASAMKIDPECAEAYNYSAVVYFTRGMIAEAEWFYDRALELRADYPEALNNKANLLNVQGKIEDSYHYYRKVVELRPDLVHARSNLLLSMNYNPAVTQEEIYSESVAWEKNHPDKLELRTYSTYTFRRSPGKLRIGFISPDFRNHSVAYFFEPLLCALDKDRFEIVCYSDVTYPDITTRRLMANAETWHDITGMSTDAVAQLVHAEGIQILVDLTGHTGRNRLAVFMEKPAPIHVSWLGYPNTTGLSTMDYRLCDAITDPEGENDRWYTEQLVRLQHGFLCYAPPHEDSPPVTARPYLRNGFITFGSFNNSPKISSDLIEVWSQLLRKVSDSQLLLKSNYFIDASIRNRYLDLFSAHGVDPKRVILFPHEPTTRLHLERYAQMDIALDTFPYNGTTTTCEALWMGVPVVTLCGTSHAGRVGASILARVGLGNLVAQSKEEYVAIAERLAGERKCLEQMSHGLREKVTNSPLCDADQFTKTVEKSFSEMWDSWTRSHLCDDSPDPSSPLKKS